MKNKKSLIVGILIMALLVVSIGYAAITTITLNITGSASAKPDTSNFKVLFTGTPTVSDANRVAATIDEQNKKEATLTVTGLTAKGDYVTAVYTVKNESPDLSASLGLEVSKNTNTEYFKVEPTYKDASIGAKNTTELTVKVTLIKTPLDDQSAEIGVKLSADPVQPTSQP